MAGCSTTTFPMVTPDWPSGTVSISTTGNTLPSLYTAPALGSLASSAAGRLAMSVNPSAEIHNFIAEKNNKGAYLF